MKKVMSVIFALCLLVTGCLSFFSCSKVNVADVEKDSSGVINDTLNNTMDKFFEDDARIKELITATKKNGAINLSFESDTLMGDISKISETIYLNEADKKMASDTVVMYQNAKFSAQMFMDQNGIIVSGEDLLGKDEILLLNYSSFFKDFKNSSLANILTLSKEEAGEIADALKGIKTSLEATSKLTEKEAKQLTNELHNTLNKTVKTQELTNSAGKKVDCVVITYEINNDTLKAYMEKAMTANQTSADEITKLNEYFTTLNKTTTINLTATININQKSSTLLSASLDGSIAVKEDKKVNSTTIDGDITFSEKEIKATVSTCTNKESQSLECKITKEKLKKGVTYKLTINKTEKDSTTNPINLSYTYQKDGAITLEADIYDTEENARNIISLGGQITKTDTNATIEFTSLQMKDVTLTIKANITFTKDVPMPEFPTSGRDIITMSKNKWGETLTDIITSDLISILTNLDK